MLPWSEEPPASTSSLPETTRQISHAPPYFVAKFWRDNSKPTHLGLTSAMPLAGTMAFFILKMFALIGRLGRQSNEYTWIYYSDLPNIKIFAPFCSPIITPTCPSLFLLNYVKVVYRLQVRYRHNDTLCLNTLLSLKIQDIFLYNHMNIVKPKKSNSIPQNNLINRRPSNFPDCL